MSMERSNAIEHLERSRQQIRGTYQHPIHNVRAVESSGDTNSIDAGAWLDLLLLLPKPKCLVSALQLWASSQPLRDAANIANQTVRSAINPIAQTRPWTLVISAAVLGAVIVKTPAWGWLIRTAFTYSAHAFIKRS